MQAIKKTIKKLIIASALIGGLNPTLNTCAMDMVPYADNQHMQINQQLLEAAKERDTQAVITALNNKADVNTKDGLNHTPLHYAARNHCTEIVKILIGHGADANALSSDQETPLHEAHDHASTVGILLHHQAHVNIYNTIQQTPLLMAIMRDNTKVVRMLMEAGANPNLTDIYGTTAWQKAAGNSAMTQIMRKGLAVAEARELTNILKEYLFEAGIVGVVEEYVDLSVAHKKQKKRK